MEEPGTQRLTNDDFRKLLASGSKTSSSTTSAKTPSTSSSGKKTDKSDARKKKKSFYTQHKRADEEQTRLTELSEKYRDRARERRDGLNTDQNFDPRTSTSGYRAVAPDLGLDAAERRRKMIQESKFLGGDLLHTHLVKGLDYALLQKVRSEINQQEKFQEAEMEKLAEERAIESEIVEVNEKESEEAEFKTVMGMNIHRMIQLQKSRTVERNEMFSPGRMAFLVDLEDENAESDIPTTIIRSKAEFNAAAELHTLESTHDIVVNKLAQIFSYLRQGGKKKNKKKDKEVFKMPEVTPMPSTSSSSSSHTKSKRNKEEDSIYGDIGDYKPSSSSSYKDYKDHRRSRYDDRDDYHHKSSSSSSSSSKKDKRGSYFDKPAEEDVPINIPAPPKLPASYISKLVAAEIDGYQECYPGLEEMNDAVIDSDEEVDYTKMDKGSKKGAIGRWDFETQDEYSDYMNQREALPKAAFQYGLKMSEGRKTRKNKNENQKLDQEWQKIQKIITKRKGDGDGGSEMDFKKSKH